jgi:serine/threonine protein kinase
VFVNVCRVGKRNDTLAAVARFKRALGLVQVDTEVHVHQKVCEELNVAKVGAIFKGIDRILKDYTLGKKIGEGAFSEVFLLRSKTSRSSAFADKIISKLNEAYDHPSLEKEVQIMKQTVHPNVMRLFAVYDEPFKTHLVI